MSKTFHELGTDTAKKMRGTAQKALGQAGKQSKSNADLQGFLVTNCTRVPVPDSRTSNPAKSNENEKHDLADQQRQKLKDHLGSAIGWLTTGVLPSLAMFAAAGSPMVAAAVTLPAKAADLAALVLKIGMHRSHGWEMKRMTDGWLLLCKLMKVTAETAIHFRTPAFFVSTDTHHMAATTSLEVVDVKTVVSQDEIHRVANAFGLEGTFLTALLLASATIHANGKVDIASLLETDVSAATNLNLKAGLAIHLEATSHTIADHLGGSIGLTAGRIDLNPLVPVAVAGAPTVVAPVVPAIPLHLPAATQKMPQYEGQGAHGALLT